VDDPDLMAALGKMFADHCRTRIFGFDYCDVLASKAELFYELGEIGLKADIAIAMLRLGLEHNRWFVERKFLQMVSPSAPDAMAERMIVELSVLQIDFKGQFEKMQSSISVTDEALHPLLRLLLA
jgi:eukaryotic-like serine/threonine-protein kinase